MTAEEETNRIKPILEIMNLEFMLEGFDVSMTSDLLALLSILPNMQVVFDLDGDSVGEMSSASLVWNTIDADYYCALGFEYELKSLGYKKKDAVIPFQRSDGNWAIHDKKGAEIELALLLR